jgi:Ca-activated chloride channel family protein
VPDVAFHLNAGASATAPPASLQTSGGQRAVTDFIKEAQTKAGEAAQSRGDFADKTLKDLPKDAKADEKLLGALNEARDRFQAYRQAQSELQKGQLSNVQSGALGVHLSVASDGLRNASCQQQNAQRWIGTRNCLEVGGVWIDEAYEAKMKTVTVKAHSNAYFRIVERHPEARKVFTMGNYLVWVTPSGTALVIDAMNGQEQMPDAEIDALFVARK